MKKIVLVFTAAVLILPLFNSCSSRSKAVSMTALFEKIDIYLSLNDTKEAFSLLKEADKSASTYFEKLGVYKRYIILGDDKKAEALLSKTLKEFPENKQVRACFVSFLLDKKRYEEAVKASVKLKDSDYASLYAESSLRLLLKEKNPDAFKDSSLISVYLDAWKASSDSIWLKNAVLLYMAEGNFLQAASLFPESVKGEDDVLFWQKVLYDAKEYERSAIAGEGEAFFTDSSKELEHLMLLADSYHLIHDEEKESLTRNKIFSKAEEINLFPSEENEGLSKAYMNEVLYWNQKNNLEKKFEGINYLLSVNPTYLPALSLYAQSAIDYKPLQEDKYMKELRKSGLKTLEMQESDNMPRASLDIALFRIENAMNISDSAGLKVLYHYFLSECGEKLTLEKSPEAMWEFLEKNTKGQNLYPQEVLDYAVDTLIKENSIDMAELIFKRNIDSLYGEDFDIVKKPELLRKRELEYAAWFAACRSDIKTAEALYTYLNEHYAKDIVTLVNLSVICSGLYRDEEAVKLLSEASSIAEDSFTKSEILYRTGRLSDSLGDKKNAIRSLQYALQLNPSNNKARLLLKTIME